MTGNAHGMPDGSLDLLDDLIARLHDQPQKQADVIAIRDRMPRWHQSVNDCGACVDGCCTTPESCGLTMPEPFAYLAIDKRTGWRTVLCEDCTHDNREDDYRFSEWYEGPLEEISEADALGRSEGRPVHCNSCSTELSR